MESTQTSNRYMIDRPKASGEKVEHCSLYYTHDEEPLKWSASFPLPQLHDIITVTMNGLGKATVVGYFTESGYLGVHVSFHNPPKWWKEQRNREKKNEPERWSRRPQWSKDGIGCVYGAEISL